MYYLIPGWLHLNFLSQKTKPAIDTTLKQLHQKLLKLVFFFSLQVSQRRTISKYPSKALVAQETLKGHQQNSSRSLL